MSYEQFDRWRHTALTTQPDVTVVIPAYNEQHRIVPTIASIAAHMAASGWTWELIVADDGSTDGTPAAVAALGWANLRVVTSGRNEGKGAAVRRGLGAARGRAVLFADADCSTPIDELDPMLERLGAGADIVIGSRMADGAETAHKSAARHLFSDALRLVVSATLRVGVRDTQCGFKLFDLDVAHALAGSLTIDGFSFDLEVLHLARRWGLTVAEHPVAWFDAPGSTVDPTRESMRFLRDIARIRWRGLTGVHSRSMPEGRVPAQPDGDLEPMRLAVVTPVPPSMTTLNEYGAHLVAALASKPEVGELIVLHDDLPAGSDRPQRQEQVRPVAAWRFGSWTNVVRIARALRRERPDAVLFNLQFATFGNGRVAAALGLLAPAVVRRLGIPTVVLLHNLVDTVDLRQAGYAKNGLLVRMYTLIGRSLTRVVLAADRVAVTIPAYVDILRDRYGASNVYLAPHGVFETANHDVSVPDGPHQILTFGKFGTYKRVDTVIEAYRLVLAAGFSDVELVIAGSDAATTPGYLESVERANNDLPGLRFTGYVDEDDVESIFRSASMVVFPYTTTTGSSGPLHQAGSYGRAAVLPAIGDLLELIRDEGFTAEEFDVDDSMSMAGAITRLLEDDGHRDQIAAQNAAAASALPLTDIVDWHLSHLAALSTTP